MSRDLTERTTVRLLLRNWRAEDRAPFAELNADAEVVQHLLGPIAREQSDAMVDRIAQHIAREGFGWWAVEAPGIASFIGMVGISIPAYTAAFTPGVEVGWRLARPYWGQGYATEAARAALGFGFDALGLSEIVALTVPDNTRSLAVMAKLGMTRSEADDFDHPMVPVGHRLQPHVLYRMARENWLKS